MASFYRQRSPAHLKQLGKRVVAAEHGAEDGDESMSDFVTRDRKSRLPAIKAADKRVAKHRKNHGR